jgi:hypothetical protein
LRAFPDAPRIRQRYCFGHTLGGAGLSAQGVHKGPHDYAVVWRTGDGPTSSGRLELAEDGLVLHGAGGPEGLRIPFAELSSVEIGRGAGERINGDKSVVLERLTSTAAPKRAAVAEFPLGVVYVGEAVLGCQLTRPQPLSDLLHHGVPRLGAPEKSAIWAGR